MRLRNEHFVCRTLSLILCLTVSYCLYFHRITTREIKTAEIRAAETAKDALPPSDNYTREWKTKQEISFNITVHSKISEGESRRITKTGSSSLQSLSMVSKPSKKIKPGSSSINPTSIRPITLKPVTGKPVAFKRNSSTPVSETGTEDTMDEYSDMGGIVIKQSNESMPVNPHPFQYTLNPEKTCDVGPSYQLFLLVYVHTRPGSIKHRELIRSTWGDVRNYAVTVRRIFVMGLPEGEYLQKAVNRESNLYHDIVQENFLDTYRNLTYKAIGALRWVKDYCSNAKFVLKTDDDAFVNMPILLDLLVYNYKTGVYGPRSLICNATPKQPVLRKGKWAVTLAQRKHPIWPTFCQGLAYIMTPWVAAELYNASFYMPFLWIDDVYVTGFLAKRIGIVHTKISQYYILEQKFETQLKNQALWKNVLFAHARRHDRRRGAWNTVIKHRNNSTTIGNPHLATTSSAKAAVPTKSSFATTSSTQAVEPM